MSKTIFIFDMDNTLFITPEMADLVKVDDDNVVSTNKSYSDYFIKIKGLFWDVLSKDIYFKRSGDFIVPINKSNDKPFKSDLIEYFKDKADIKRMFIEKDGILTLDSFPGFHSDPDTLGMLLNEPIFKEYENASNRMIITGRDEELRGYILDIFKELPNNISAALLMEMTPEERKQLIITLGLNGKA